MLTRLEVMLSEELAEAQSELAEWRTGKRRVFWELRINDAYGMLPVTIVRANAMNEWRPRKEEVDSLKRITVGPRGNVRPWRKK